MILNSFILYKESNAGKILSRYDYTADIVYALANEWSEARNPNVRPMDGGGDGVQNVYGIDDLPGRREKNCFVCIAASTAAGGPRKSSWYSCKKCQRGVNPLCFGENRC